MVHSTDNGHTAQNIVNRLNMQYPDAMLEASDIVFFDGYPTIDGMPPDDWADAMFADDPDNWDEMGIPPNAGSSS